MSPTLAILAGGFATRLRPLTTSLPKSLIDIGGRPFIDYQLARARAGGLSDVVLCVGYGRAQIEAHVGGGERYGLRVRYADDGAAPAGTGGALRGALAGAAQPNAEPFTDPFLVMYGDSYLDADYGEIVGRFARARLRTGSVEGLMTVYRNADQYDRSNVAFAAGRIRAYDKERPTSAMRYIDWGLGVLTHAALTAPALPAGAFDLALVFQDLLRRDALVGCEVPTRFYEIGSFAGLAEFRGAVAAGLIAGSP